MRCVDLDSSVRPPPPIKGNWLESRAGVARVWAASARWLDASKWPVAMSRTTTRARAPIAALEHGRRR